MAEEMTYVAPPIYVRYEPEIEAEISHLSTVIMQSLPIGFAASPRWLSIQLLEEDPHLVQAVQQTSAGTLVTAALAESLNRLRVIYPDGIDVALVDQRYTFVHQLVRRVINLPVEHRITLSERVDRVVTHRWLGIPIFLLLMWIVFTLTTDVAAPLVDWVDAVINGPVINRVVALLGLIRLHGTWVERMVLDGVIVGVGRVLVFIPVLMALYLALAVLEDSGYMARAAFVMDRLMHALGLHGKSFLPMIVGFGCTVPAFYATRTLKHEQDRILTGLLVPFMSCGARLPVYVLMATIFFPRHSGWVVFVIYLIGILTAIILGLVLKPTLFRTSQPAPFIMELPPYRIPTIRNIWFHMWERSSLFIRKAWTIIMITSILIWLLTATPLDGRGTFADVDLEQSAFATIANTVAPVFAPLGFGSWEASGALVTGFVAKEVVISTMAQVYHVDEVEDGAAPATVIEDIEFIVVGFTLAVFDAIKAMPLLIGVDLSEYEAEDEPSDLMLAIRRNFEASSGGHGALAALSFMLFVLIYTPCVTAVAAQHQEFGKKWVWFSILGQLALAWLVAWLVFQGGKFLGWG